MKNGQVFPMKWNEGVEVLPKEIQLHRVIGQFPVPTEKVVTDCCTPFVPLMGRIFSIKDIGQYKQCAVEVWLDAGEDGHTEVNLYGVMILDTHEVITSNDLSFMKTSSWLCDKIFEMYNEWAHPKNKE